MATTEFPTEMCVDRIGAIGAKTRSKSSGGNLPVAQSGETRLAKVVFALVCGVFLTAATRGTEVTATQIAQFQKGVATIMDVESKIGMPQQTSQLPNGDTTADYILLQESANAASYVPFARLAAGAMNVHEVKVEFEFEPSGNLVSVRTLQRDMSCPHRVCTDQEKSQLWTPAPAEGD